MGFQSKVYSVSDEEFISIVNNADSYSDCLRALGLGTNGGHSTDVLKRRMKELNLSSDHFTRKAQKTTWENNFFAKEDLSKILVENSPFISIPHLKEKILKAKLLPYKCDCCGIETWQGKKIVLQLHHKNGNKRDNRIENLCLLCPNCHSQTENYGAKNNTRKE